MPWSRINYDDHIWNNAMTPPLIVVKELELWWEAVTTCTQLIRESHVGDQTQAVYEDFFLECFNLKTERKRGK